MSREMKDSGVEWIGDIPINWNCCKQKYLIQLLNGRAYKDSEFEENGKYKILRVGNLFTNPTWYTSSLELESNKYCDKGDLLYSWSMTYAPFIWNGGKVIFHYHIWKTLLSNKIDKKFAYYYLIALTDALQAEIHETTMGFITMGVMNASYIAYPILEEQKKITYFIDRKCSAIDTAIEKTKKSIEKLEEYKKAVITKAVTKGLDPNAKMKDSGVEWIGEVPETWDVVKTKYLFRILKRIARKEGFDVISITQSGLKVKDIKSNEGQLAENYSNYQFVFPGDFAMNHMDLLTGWIDLSVLYGVTSPDYRVFRRIKENVNNDYYKYLFQSLYFNKIYYGLAQGVAEVGRKRLQAPVFKEVRLPFPSIKEQTEIVEYINDKCSSIDALIVKKQEAISKWEEYKKSLIYYAVTGKIDCRNEAV